MNHYSSEDINDISTYFIKNIDDSSKNLENAKVESLCIASLMRISKSISNDIKDLKN